MKALSVACPWCNAPTGKDCTTPRGTLPDHGVHRARWRAHKHHQWNERTQP